MHDPSFLLAAAKPLGLDVWHDEPGGRDSGEVCGYPPFNSPLRRAVWAIRHLPHLRFRWWPYLNVRRWIVDRCADCGQRFRWREGRHSYQSTDKVWHSPCMSLRHVRSQLEDITEYVLCTADEDTRWRVEYRLKALERPMATDGSEGGGK